ncbi:MAG: primosomal protein N' [Actinobacteria bacterium]|nr:primosomal protein N' [Actinomycetota bacterium]
MSGREQPSCGEGPYVEVIIDAPARQLDRPFTYRVPPHLREGVRTGSVVLVPLLSTLQVGYVLGFCTDPGLPRMRDLEAVIDEPPVFDEELVRLCAWISRRYLSSLVQAIRLVIPPGRARRVTEMLSLAARPEEILSRTPPRASRRRELVRALADAGGEVPLDELKEALGGKMSPQALKALVKSGDVNSRYVLLRPRASRIKVRVVELSPQGERSLAEPEAARRWPARVRLLRALQEHGGVLTVAEMQRLGIASGAALKGAEEAGWVRVRLEERLRDPFAERSFPPVASHVLNRDQEAALRQIIAGLERGGGVFLLHGVTGSGKTEVYLHAIEDVLQKGKSALVLVPEIALTPQMVQRFKGRLGEEVAVLHSRLGLGERYDQWRGIREGRYRVVIGARSALFAPLPDLGLIVIDEEHENTYKESSPPRYLARDVARERARLSGAVLVLGSATPSLETHHSALTGESTLLRLPNRVDDRPLPKMEVVDMRELSERGELTIISPRLLNALARVYRAGEQAILFLNRRGFARFLQCHRCGHIFRCINCSVSLCYHAGGPHLLCHHCNWMLRPPFACPDCGNQVHRYAGIGTERVEQELRRLLPSLRCLRMDADTTARKDAHWDILEDFRQGRAHVLLGTQMIAKGLDIPNVTLVGVINADTSLALPDFRAGERTFQLLTQVSGRAGRGRSPGRVIVQTFSPHHYAVRAAVEGDQEAFYRRELSFRREAWYPPFSRLVNLVVTAAEESLARDAAGVLAQSLGESARRRGAALLGPAPAPLSRLKGRYRFHLTLKAPSLEGWEEELQNVFISFASARKSLCRRLGVAEREVSLAVDVDPVTLL